ncbi:MAG: hypothetical protein ACRDRS_24435 [Pseudonocardiaceae bacterium]
MFWLDIHSPGDDEPPSPPPPVSRTATPPRDLGGLEQDLKAKRVAHRHLPRRVRTDATNAETDQHCPAGVSQPS